ncbi:hypothetical protein Syun_023034 [Stephania yunnanensis]|uniref:Pentatricopeptide repeat-containing protein n=1 Tax=Stephania yunnanensis TaxID=152371 RepID=A0AAP0HZ60_9MAGN
MGFIRYVTRSQTTKSTLLRTQNLSPFPSPPQTPFWAPKNHLHRPPFLPELHSASIHTKSLSTQFENPTNVIDSVSEDSEKICKILSNSSGFQGIDQFVDGSGLKVSSKLVEQVLKKLSNAGALALSFFRWAEKRPEFKPTSECYNALIDGLGKIKQFKLIWKLVSDMRSRGLVSRDTFGLIIRRYARARKVKEAVEAFESMERFGFKPELPDFNRLIDTLSKSRQVKKAHQVFDEMKNKRFVPDLKSYTILLEGWGQEQNIVMVKEIYREMRDDGFEPDVVTYGIMINAFCKSKKFDEAIALFREMEATKCEPTQHVYCTLINGLGSENRLSEALEFFERSKSSGLVPEVPTYNAVVGSYCWAKRFDDAYRVVDEMRKTGFGPNSRTFDIILHHLIRARRTKQVYFIFQKMRSEFKCEPTISTYTIMVNMFCKEERVDMALKMWEQMKASGILPGLHMFSSLINGFCAENRLDDACMYFQEMLALGIRPPANLYSNLKQALIDAGKNDVALSLGLKLDKVRKTPLAG